MPWLAYKPFGDIHSICPWANTPILVIPWFDNINVATCVCIMWYRVMHCFIYWLLYNHEMSNSCVLIIACMCLVHRSFWKWHRNNETRSFLRSTFSTTISPHLFLNLGHFFKACITKHTFMYLGQKARDNMPR